jgi:hypothetical protein
MVNDNIINTHCKFSKLKLPSSVVLLRNKMERGATYNPSTSPRTYHSQDFDTNDTLFHICTRVSLLLPEVCYLYLDHLVKGNCCTLSISFSPTLVLPIVSVLAIVSLAIVSALGVCRNLLPHGVLL